MTATVYSLNASSNQSGTLLNHQNTSGGNERVIINYIRMKKQTAVNGYMELLFGPTNDLCNLKITYCTAFGKHVACSYDMYNNNGHNGHKFQSHSGSGANEELNAPTEIMLADQEYFQITWYGPNFIQGCNIVVIPEA